jgi:phage terminase large subunit-like protein
MSAPCKEIERAILERQFKAGGDPILRWNIANIRVEPDVADNINSPSTSGWASSTAPSPVAGERGRPA